VKCHTFMVLVKFLMTRSALCCVTTALAVLLAGSCVAQSVPYQRTFPQPAEIVEKRLKELQSSSAGHLPTLEGFRVPDSRPLDHFRRGYYQCTAHVSATASGGSVVRVNATISAWYTDPVSGKSGYEVLPSNGRLEADFLDRLQDLLDDNYSSSIAKQGKSASSAPAAGVPSQSSAVQAAQSKARVGSPFNLGNPLGLDHMSSLATQKAVIDRRAEEEEKEVNGLQEILRNQAHPENLVAVKKKDTPIFANPIENAKVLFLAAAEDEFEILDSNPYWVHVRISGLSRGWIRRSSVEMPSPESGSLAAESEARAEPAQPDAQPFQVENEQTASFPGDWAPLLGKMVRIVTVQKAIDNVTVTGPQAKLAFAQSLFDREYADITSTSSGVVGVVVIFDSEDGGMIATTLPALRQRKEGTLSAEAFWRRCFFDPREAFGMTANP
jgi:hypothetical protein